MNDDDFRRMAEQYLYVPSGGRKLPLKGWKWSKKCDDDIDPRSEENPWVFTYEQTLDERVLSKLNEHYPRWDNTWIRVGVRDGLTWVNVDLDTNPEGHDEYLPDDEEIRYSTPKPMLVKTENGSHMDFVAEDDGSLIRGRGVPGIDYQGTMDGMLGVVGDPFHDSEGYELKKAGEVLKSPQELTDDATLSYRGAALFRSMDPDEMERNDIEYEVADQDLPLRVTDVLPGIEPGGRVPHPFHGSSTGGNFGVDEDGYTCRCESGRHNVSAGNVTGNAYHIIAQRHGILECGDWVDHPEGYAGKRDEIVEVCDEEGLPVPPHWRDGEHEAYLGAVDEMGRGDMEEVWDIRRELKSQLSAAAEAGVSGHVVGPKGSGKTHNIVELAASGHRVTAVAPTIDKYEEIIAEAEDRGVSTLRLPSFPEHSAIYDEWEEHYHSGAYPRELYSWDGRDDVDEYRRRSEEDWDQYDLLVGAPQHLFLDSAVEDRVVLADDVDLTTFYNVFDPSDHGADINRVLERVGSEYESYQQLEREGDWQVARREIVRHMADAREATTVEEALELVQDDELDRRALIEDIGVHLGVLDWMRVMSGSPGQGEDYIRFAHDGKVTRVHVRAPNLAPAEMVWTMGAVPVVTELEPLFNMMGVRFDGMFGSARHGDMERAVDRWTIQTSEFQHCKSSPARDHNPDRVLAIKRGLEALGRELGIDEEAQVFSTLAETRHIRGAENYAGLTGTNRHGDRHLAVAGGASHYGDDYVRMRAAAAGRTPREAEREGFAPAVWDDECHAEVDRNMRSGGVYEAVTRMGRSDAATTLVAADTAALPQWLQVVDQSGRVDRWSGAERALHDFVSASNAPVQIKNADGVGAEDALDYSAVRLYEAKRSLVDAGVLRVCGETGAYNAERLEEDGELVSSGVKGITKAGLTGADISPAENPDWDLMRFDTAGTASLDPRQMELSQVTPSD